MGIEIEFQSALYLALDTAKASLGLKKVCDVAPQAVDGAAVEPFPYATMGMIFPVMMDTQTTIAFDITSRIHFWGRTDSMAEIKTIQGKVFDLLHRSKLSITGYNNFLLLRSETDCWRESNGTIHGLCEYRALVEKSA